MQQADLGVVEVDFGPPVKVAGQADEVDEVKSGGANASLSKPMVRSLSISVLPDMVRRGIQVWMRLR